MFSENPLIVEKNIDLLIKSLFIQILKLTEKAKGDNQIHPITICANILSIMLEDERLYTAGNPSLGKTKGINNLILNTIPTLKNLLKNKDLTEGILSLLSLIVEKVPEFISTYQNEGIIDQIFALIKDSIDSNDTCVGQSLRGKEQ